MDNNYGYGYGQRWECQWGAGWNAQQNGYNDIYDGQFYYQNHIHWQQINSQGLVAPPLDHPDPYVHYQFITELKNMYNFNNSMVVPHSLINYFLGYLSQEQCQYPKTALQFMVTNIGDLSEKLAQHQLDYLIKLITKRYPSQIDYEKEYEKLLIMDSQQADKFVQLLEMLCVIYCQIQQKEQSNKNFMNEVPIGSSYLNWQVNYLLVLYRHSEEIEKQLKSQFMQDQKQKVRENIQGCKIQLLSLLNQKQVTDSAFLDKLCRIIYKQIPNNFILSPQESHLIWEFIKVLNKICQKTSIDTSSILFGSLMAFLMKQMQKISLEIGSLKTRVIQSAQIRGKFESFSIKALNVLSLKLWTKNQSLQVIQLLSSCKFLCCLDKTDKDQSKDYDGLIEEAYAISNHKNTNLQLPLDTKTMNTLQLSDDW